MAIADSTGIAQALAFWADLAPKERDVATEMAHGWANVEIANRLALSPKTVDNRVSAIYENLPVTSGMDRRVQTALLVRSVIERRGHDANIV